VEIAGRCNRAALQSSGLVEEFLRWAQANEKLRSEILSRRIEADVATKKSVREDHVSVFAL
jgi:hypothetical protein